MLRLVASSKVASASSAFPIGRNERGMSNDSFHFTEQFLIKIEAAHLDDDTVRQLQELSTQDRAKLVRLLEERTNRRRTSN
jgi:hypothetical protein